MPCVSATEPCMATQPIEPEASRGLTLKSPAECRSCWLPPAALTSGIREPVSRFESSYRNWCALRCHADAASDDRSSVARFDTRSGGGVESWRFGHRTWGGSDGATGRARTESRTRCAFALARYHRDGTLDATFGGDGKVVTDASASRNGSGASAVAIDAAGRIVAAGSDSKAVSHTIVVRYLN